MIYILILILLDSIMFAGEPTPKLRRVKVIDPISMRCPADVKKLRLTCPEG